MQTTLEIEDSLLQRAMVETGAPTQSSAVEAALRLLLQMHAQQKLRELRGQVAWDGDLETSRESRFLDSID